MAAFLVLSLTMIKSKGTKETKAKTSKLQGGKANEYKVPDEKLIAIFTKNFELNKLFSILLWEKREKIKFLVCKYIEFPLFYII
jgi:hypothetical protein